MLERCFCPRVCCRMRANPLGPSLERMADYLVQRGHTGFQQYMQAAEHFGRWVGTQGISPAAVDAAVVQRFLTRHLPHCHCRHPASRYPISNRAALRHLLRCMGKVPSNPAGRDTASAAVDSIVKDFDEYLRKVGGLADNTRLYRRRYVHEFLQANFRRGPVRWKRLAPPMIMNFVADYARRCSPATGQVAASAISSLLRFAQFHGFCDAQLVAAVPWIPAWKRGANPEMLTAGQVRDVLGSFDRTTIAGRRNYAIALCMTDLGMRVSEVAALCLEDMDWRHATIRLTSSKVRRARILPLPQRVGRAIATYLRHRNASSPHREVFLRHRPPVGEPVSKETIRGGMRRAYMQCGLGRFTGTHILRHTAASLMHQRGVTLKQIADLLGHRSLDSTVIYARANLPELATAALPWPEVRS
jgi:integrase/recombinase XerD